MAVVRPLALRSDCRARRRSVLNKTRSSVNIKELCEDNDVFASVGGVALRRDEDVPDDDVAVNVC